MYEALRHKQEKKIWQKLICFTLHVSKCSFVSWLVILNRLPTRDRLAQWGIKLESQDCLLCHSHDENRNHLFFSCDFSKMVWQKVLVTCGFSRAARDWDYEFQWTVTGG